MFIIGNNLECYGYDEEWVILKEVKNNTDDNDMDITTDQQPYIIGDKVKCNFKNNDDGSVVVHNGIVKRSFQQNGSWEYIVVFADETVLVDHNYMEKQTDDV